MSSSGAMSSLFSTPVTSFQYRETTSADPDARPMPGEPVREVLMAEQEFADRLDLARAEAAAGVENRLRHEYEARARHEAAKVAAALEAFQRERKEYFARVEAEVVRLALSIAAKILHREAQVDPMLVAALVHIAVGQLRDGSGVSLRVRPEEAPQWCMHLGALAPKNFVHVCEDSELEPGDCILETELGTANFSLTAQLKEVEQGFFDVLAQRPPAQ